MTQTVAETILEQLGGSRFIAMTGFRNGVSYPRGLRFQMPRGFARGGIDLVEITLNEKDLYNITFMKKGTARNLYEPTMISQFEDVYNDSLRETFTRVTGLDTFL